jgi:hypothetical protein
MGIITIPDNLFLLYISPYKNINLQIYNIEPFIENYKSFEFYANNIVQLCELYIKNYLIINNKLYDNDIKHQYKILNNNSYLVE